MRIINIILIFLFLHNTCISTGDSTHSSRIITPDESWWKGNLHTHSLWSDGNDFPEVIAEWYKKHGYHFLTLSDHNIISQGDHWILVEKSNRMRKGTPFHEAVAFDTVKKYREIFSEDWVEERIRKGKPEIRLKPLREFRHLYEEPGKFLLIQSEEISDNLGDLAVHINATNLLETILPQGGDSILEMMQNNINAVLEQRDRTRQPMFPHLNHPNAGGSMTAEEMALVKGERFFEIYNPCCAGKDGDEYHAGIEDIWDIILAKRLLELDREIMYGIAVDDAHHYPGTGTEYVSPGRGWVVVQAPHLTPEAIISAMEAGNFYSSTGVAMRDVHFDGDTLSLDIIPEDGIRYTTHFIGTPRDIDLSSEAVVDDKGYSIRATRRYSDEIGMTFAQEVGINPSYTFRGDELYIRAKVISTKPHPLPYSKGDLEQAWTQPVQAFQQ